MTKQAMTPEQFKAWMHTMDVRYQDAADLLGVSIDQVKSMALGRRDVSTPVAMACAAAFHRLNYRDAPWMR